MEKEETEFLNMIYRNAEMGRDGLYFVLRKTDDTAFRKVVETQLMEYQSIMDEAEDLIRQQGAVPDGNPVVAKIAVRRTAARKAAKDNSPSALADMLIQGSSMGVTKIARQISHREQTSEEVTALAAKLQETEENNIDRMKKYL